MSVDHVIARVQQAYARWSRDTTVVQMRADWDALFAARGDARVEPVNAGGVACEWVRAPGVREDRAVLYFHGGGFQIGSLASHRELMALLSVATGVQVLGVGYRLAPECRHPAALDDALSVFEWIQTCGLDRMANTLPPASSSPRRRGSRASQDFFQEASWCVARKMEALDPRLRGDDEADEVAIGQRKRCCGLPPERVAFAGDSAGGGLALSTMLALSQSGRALPAAGLLMSAWTDLTASGDSHTTRAAADPINRRAMLLALARNYLGEGVDATDPRISPAFAAPEALAALPPLLFQVGAREIVLSDSETLARRARVAGVRAELQVWPGMVHVFQQFPELPEAREAIAAAGHFLASHLVGELPRKSTP